VFAAFVEHFFDSIEPVLESEFRVRRALSMTIDLAVPKSEFAARMQAAGETLVAMGAHCAVLMAPETQYWLCGFDSFLGAQLPQALSPTPAGDEPSLVV
jgi:hypothetical protein